jgi:ABC-2 type transport system permease protein
MRTIRFLLKKEFLQIFCNKALLPLIFAVPVVQLLILSNAANYEIYNLRVHVMDFDQTSSSRELISQFEASPYFEVVNYSYSENQAHQDIEQDQADLMVRIPGHFEKDLATTNQTNVQLLVNAINGSTAGLANAYANSIILDFSTRMQTSWHVQAPSPSVTPIQIVYAHWYNPRMNYKTYIVPGILVVLVTMTGMFLTAMNIVREKEVGTIEQVNVTPVRKYEFIIGKLLPFWLIALFELAPGLIVARLVFHIPMVGSVGLIFSFAGLYLLVVLGLGLLISTFTETMQQSMFVFSS